MLGTGSRQRRMVSLGKVTAPKPVNLPSQKKENNGNDPAVTLVPKASATWGETTTTPSATEDAPKLPPRVIPAQPSPAWGGAGLPEERRRALEIASREQFPSLSANPIEPDHRSKQGSPRASNGHPSTWDEDERAHYSTHERSSPYPHQYDNYQQYHHPQTRHHHHHHHQHQHHPREKPPYGNDRDRYDPMDGPHRQSGDPGHYYDNGSRYGGTDMDSLSGDRGMQMNRVATEDGMRGVPPPHYYHPRSHHDRHHYQESPASFGSERERDRTPPPPPPPPPPQGGPSRGSASAFYSEENDYYPSPREPLGTEEGRHSHHQHRSPRRHHYHHASIPGSGGVGNGPPRVTAHRYYAGNGEHGHAHDDDQEDDMHHYHQQHQDGYGHNRPQPPRSHDQEGLPPNYGGRYPSEQQQRMHGENSPRYWDRRGDDRHDSVGAAERRRHRPPSPPPLSTHPERYQRSVDVRPPPPPPFPLPGTEDVNRRDAVEDVQSQQQQQQQQQQQHGYKEQGGRLEVTPERFDHAVTGMVAAAAAPPPPPPPPPPPLRDLVDLEHERTEEESGPKIATSWAAAAGGGSGGSSSVATPTPMAPIIATPSVPIASAGNTISRPPALSKVATLPSTSPGSQTMAITPTRILKRQNHQQQQQHVVSLPSEASLLEHLTLSDEPTTTTSHATRSQPPPPPPPRPANAPTMVARSSLPPALQGLSLARSVVSLAESNSSLHQRPPPGLDAATAAGSNNVSATVTATTTHQSQPLMTFGLGFGGLQPPMPIDGGGHSPSIDGNLSLIGSGGASAGPPLRFGDILLPEAIDGSVDGIADALAAGSAAAAANIDALLLDEDEEDAAAAALTAATAERVIVEDDEEMRDGRRGPGRAGQQRRKDLDQATKDRTGSGRGGAKGSAPRGGGGRLGKRGSGKSLPPGIIPGQHLGEGMAGSSSSFLAPPPPPPPPPRQPPTDDSGTAAAGPRAGNALTSLQNRKPSAAVASAVARALRRPPPTIAAGVVGALATTASGKPGKRPPVTPALPPGLGGVLSSAAAKKGPLSNSISAEVGKKKEEERKKRDDQGEEEDDGDEEEGEGAGKGKARKKYRGGKRQQRRYRRSDTVPPPGVAQGDHDPGQDSPAGSADGGHRAETTSGNSDQNGGATADRVAAAEA